MSVLPLLLSEIKLLPLLFIQKNTFSDSVGSFLMEKVCYIEKKTKIKLLTFHKKSDVLFQIEFFMINKKAAELKDVPLL